MRSTYYTLSLPPLPCLTPTSITAAKTLSTTWSRHYIPYPSSLPLPKPRFPFLTRPLFARRRVTYDDDDDDDDYGNNSEIVMLESYSESVRTEALLVRATVDGEEETVLIFKGFSSCLSGRTSPDPARSILPERAVIESIDVIKGPFDPTKIQYLEKDLTLDAFKKTRLQNSNQQLL